MTILTMLRAPERDHDEQDWLESWRAFPARTISVVGFAAPLLAIVDDQVAGGKGFGQHAHRDIEILSYPLKGILQHKDSLGNVSTVRPGELQLMTAGTGIRHSEYNGSPIEPVRFLQIWVEPRQKGLTPGYQRITFDDAPPLQRLAAPDGAGSALKLHQDVNLWRAAPARGDTVRVPFEPTRLAWIHVVRGALMMAGQRLEAGDGAAVEGATALAVEGQSAVNEALIFVMNATAVA